MLLTMKIRWLLAVLGLILCSGGAHAFSPLVEINQKRMKDLPLAFEIRSEPLANGDIQFTVKITEGSMKFRTDWSTSLAKVHVTESSKESHGLRRLPAERQGGSITCVFTVTRKELEDPDISFFFAMPVPDEPNIDHFYAPLRNFMP